VKTIIFFHGWGADGSVWQRQVQAFQGRFRVETPTIPTWDPNWLEEYLQDYALADCLLVGWSLGGMLLLEVLSEKRVTPGGLALVGAPPVFCSRPDHPWGQPPAAVRAMRRALKSTPQKVLQDFAGNCLSPGEAAYQVQIFPLFAGANGSHLTTGLNYLLNRDLRPLLSGLPSAPSIIQGEQDRIVSPEQARFLHEYLPGSSLHLLPGAGHLPFWTQEARFNEIIEGIVNGGPGS
jgi:pimeloyl-[acyl-carrier protein] methyl ester esterase